MRRKRVGLDRLTTRRQISLMQLQHALRRTQAKVLNRLAILCLRMESRSGRAVKNQRSPLQQLTDDLRIFHNMPFLYPSMDFAMSADCFASLA